MNIVQPAQFGTWHRFHDPSHTLTRCTCTPHCTNTGKDKLPACITCPRLRFLRGCYGWNFARFRRMWYSHRVVWRYSAIILSPTYAVSRRRVSCDRSSVCSSNVCIRFLPLPLRHYPAHESFNQIICELFLAMTPPAIRLPHAVGLHPDSDEATQNVAPSSKLTKVSPPRSPHHSVVAVAVASSLHTAHRTTWPEAQSYRHLKLTSTLWRSKTSVRPLTMRCLCFQQPTVPLVLTARLLLAKMAHNARRGMQFKEPYEEWRLSTNQLCPCREDGKRQLCDHSYNSWRGYDNVMFAKEVTALSVFCLLLRPSEETRASCKAF